ncbi:MAG: hypothetical protein MUC97_02845 [Bernardetiaceae bacterium]|nr:hypothetical protein [Bernardetiaceae bacterium]
MVSLSEEEGKEEEKVATALRLIAAGAADDFITQINQLPLGQVKDLRSEA